MNISSFICIIVDHLSFFATSIRHSIVIPLGDSKGGVARFAWASKKTEGFMTSPPLVKNILLRFPFNTYG